MRSIAALLAAAAWFLVVGDLPTVSGDAGRYVAGCAGALFVALAALALLGARDEPLGVAVFGAGAGFLAAVLTSQ
ncbi:MAG TPA: hypothetical protein VGW10_19525, partial [Solirubrobacteraceae bacterium]|nr:hypothetical protein [Solirubrobacteraceae bacterium]